MTPGIVVVVESLVDQGRVDEGEQLVAERRMDGELGPTLFSVLPLLARGRVRAAAGDYVRARADLDDALHRMAESRGMFPWATDARVALVPVLRALGEDRLARTVAEDAVTAATTADSPRRIGGALHVLGLTQDGAQRLDTLRRAVDALALSPARLWRAHACVDYGVQLARDGQRADARRVLRGGMELAWRSGATPLADQATRELRAAGGRPGRRSGAGSDVLTVSERRVAELAAGGVSNKEIAQSLFVTLRTVEMHLSNAYTKLEIRSRTELGQALWP
jgi:DNA-binding NarL/FixJ family response regulator